MKHILIDARLYGPTHTGIGRYTKNLLLALTNLSDFKKYKFSLLVYPELLSEIKSDLKNNYHYISTPIRHYSLQEQLFLPFLIYQLHPDLVHFTHFNKPLLYFGKSVVTIHDLIKHFFYGQQYTTKNLLLYYIKYLSYRLLTFIIIKSNHLIVPSNYWRQFIIDHYHVSSSRIVTTHEAVDPLFLSLKTKLSTPDPYLIYTGNLYPYKNLDIILQALTKLPDLRLKIISGRNLFSQRLENLIKLYGLKKQVDFLGFVPDNQMAKIYSSALALVHPSFMEGFSLTGLEAMALNCPVISSNASCLPEIYEQSVLYFDPHNSDDLVAQIKKLQQSTSLRQKLINLGHLQIKKYSWNQTAKTTFDVYQKIINS